MTVSISCRCGWFRESVYVADQISAELLADRHESADLSRPYRHATEIVKLKEVAA
jgi:hypothetical protein